VLPSETEYKGQLIRQIQKRLKPDNLKKADCSFEIPLKDTEIKAITSTTVADLSEKKLSTGLPG